MKRFLNDIWYDLREKRLWPVAVLLVVALVAVPLVLAKPGDAPKPAPASAARTPDSAAQRAADAIHVEVADDQAGTSSTLDVFQPKDPFRPPAVMLKKIDALKASSAGSTATASSASSTSPSGTDSGSGGGSTGTSTETGSTGTQPGSGGGTTGGGKVTITRYTYVVDATFGRIGHTRHYRGLRRLRMLPTEDTPLLISLGVDGKADNAVFLVDSTLSATGEGRCKPSGPDCGVLYLGAGSEEYFTDENGDSYTLRIDEIRRVKLGKPKAHSSKTRSRRAAHARPANAGADQPGRPFELPALTDLVTVASPAGDGSRTATGSR